MHLLFLQEKYGLLSYRVAAGIQLLALRFWMPAAARHDYTDRFLQL